MFAPTNPVDASPAEEALPQGNVRSQCCGAAQLSGFCGLSRRPQLVPDLELIGDAAFHHLAPHRLSDGPGETALFRLGFDLGQDVIDPGFVADDVAVGLMRAAASI